MFAEIANNAPNSIKLWDQKVILYVGLLLSVSIVSSKRKCRPTEVSFITLDIINRIKKQCIIAYAYLCPDIGVNTCCS